MQGEALSVAIHPPTGIAAVTHPDANRLTFWSLRTQGFAGVLELDKPRGVALNADGSAFWVSQGLECRPDRGLSRNAFEVIPDRERKNTLITGSQPVRISGRGPPSRAGGSHVLDSEVQLGLVLVVSATA